MPSASRGSSARRVAVSRSLNVEGQGLQGRARLPEQEVRAGVHLRRGMPSTEMCRNQKCVPRPECDEDHPCPDGKICQDNKCTEPIRATIEGRMMRDLSRLPHPSSARWLPSTSTSTSSR